MKHLFLFLAIIFFFLSPLSPVYPENIEGYSDLMKNWDDNIKLASEYLTKAELSLKNGDALQACSDQIKASKYGIEGTESLIKAFKISGTTDDLSNLESGLQKWKEIGRACS